MTKLKKIIGKTGETSVEAPEKNDDEVIIAAVIDIALSLSASYEKRREEIIRSAKTLDQLRVALNNEG